MLGKILVIATLLFVPYFSYAETGIIAIDTQNKFCDPNGSIAVANSKFTLNDPDSLPFSFAITTARTGLNNCRKAIYFDTTTNWNTFDYIYLDYDITVTSGYCGVGLTWGDNADNSVGTYHNTSTTTTFTIDNSGGGYDGLIGLGVTLYGYSGQASNCTGNVTRLYDSNGTDYLNFYDTSLLGGNSTTTEYVTEYVPTNVAVISTLCTEETSTTTGQATTTCTNVLSTTTAYTYTLGADLENDFKTFFLWIAWLSSFLLIFYLFKSFIKTKHGSY